MEERSEGRHAYEVARDEFVRERLLQKLTVAQEDRVRANLDDPNDRYALWIGFIQTLVGYFDSPVEHQTRGLLEGMQEFAIEIDFTEVEVVTFTLEAQGLTADWKELQPKRNAPQAMRRR